MINETIETPFANGENLTATGMVSPAAKALCGSVKEYMTLPGHVFSSGGDSNQLSSGSQDSGRPLTDLERLVELDRICPETPRNPYNLARFPVGCGKTRPLRESLEFVLDDARARVGAETCGERSGDGEGEGKDVTTGLERVDLVMLASGVFSVRVRGRVEEVEVVEKERVLVMMS